jgi:hypothetical protein
MHVTFPQERIEKILSAGANVILTTKGIDEMAMKYFVEKVPQPFVHTF